MAASSHLPSAKTLPGRPRPGSVPSWMLKLTTIFAVVNVFFFGFGYASTHVKAASAPLQPSVVRGDAAPSAAPAPTTAPNGRSARRPTATLAPGIRTSPQAPLTSTRHS